eukprot:14119653-Alexandrium_andersonii.AAC.1
MSASLVGSEMCIRDSPSTSVLVKSMQLGLTRRPQLLWEITFARNKAVSYTHLTLPTICSV